MIERSAKVPELGPLEDRLLSMMQRIHVIDTLDSSCNVTRAIGKLNYIYFVGYE